MFETDSHIYLTAGTKRAAELKAGDYIFIGSTTEGYFVTRAEALSDLDHRWKITAKNLELSARAVLIVPSDAVFEVHEREKSNG